MEILWNWNLYNLRKYRIIYENVKIYYTKLASAKKNGKSKGVGDYIIFL